MPGIINTELGTISIPDEIVATIEIGRAHV